MNISRIALVIPCCNESIHIGNLLGLIRKIYGKRIDIIVIDDGSTDETALKASFFTKYVIRHELNLGKGAALKTGCIFAFYHLKADFVITMDADEQHSPTDIYKFITRLSSKNQLIFGVRSFLGMPKAAVIANKFSSFLIKLFYNLYIPDIPSGYKAFSECIYQSILWQGSGYEVELEIAKNVAEKKIPFQVVSIQTIYPNYVRGVTVLDGLKILFRILGLR